MRIVLACILLVQLAAAQGRGAAQGGRGGAAAGPAEPTAAAAERALFIRENYTKFEYRIPMRDGVKLFTSVYMPKDVFTDGRSYPIMMQRTGYNVAPYGADQYRANLGPSELFEREKFIFVYQDVRGRFMSEGDFIIIRPHKPVKSGPKDTDESTDTYDTVDWLVKHVPGNSGKVGMWGISQPGFYATAGMIDAHPALVAVSPQAPVTDYYMGDDVYHNGAFMLAHRFSFYMGFRDREGDPAPPPRTLPFDYGTPDGYDFYLSARIAGQRRREVLQAPAAHVESEHRPHHVRRELAIARHLETPQGHQARRDAGGRLVRHRGSAGPAAPVRFHGEEHAAGRHAGDGSVEPRRLRARRWRPPGQHQFRFEDRTVLPGAHRISVLPLLPEGPRRW